MESTEYITTVKIAYPKAIPGMHARNGGTYIIFCTRAGAMLRPLAGPFQEEIDYTPILEMACTWLRRDGRDVQILPEDVQLELPIPA